MGHCSKLWLEPAAGEPILLFEVANALPVFWCAAFRPEDPAGWAAAENQSTLELRIPWPAAAANLRAALEAAPGRMPGFEPRLAAFAAALDAAGARHGGVALLLDATEWTNFHAHGAAAAAALGGLVDLWHGTGPRSPAEPLHWIHQVDGLAVDPEIRREQPLWPGVPLDPLPPPLRQEPGWHEWAWVALIAGATIGGYAATGSGLAAGLAFAGTAGAFITSLWWWRPR